MHCIYLIHPCTQAHTHKCLYTHTHVPKHTHTPTHTHIHTHTHTHTNMPIHTHTYMPINKHTHTHTHTHMLMRTHTTCHGLQWPRWERSLPGFNLLSQGVCVCVCVCAVAPLHSQRFDHSAMCTVWLTWSVATEIKRIPADTADSGAQLHQEHGTAEEAIKHPKLPN